jgi:SAM-dependent methyltransferase
MTDGEEGVSGELLCTQCGGRYVIRRRMPFLYVDDERWSPKAREAEGWVGYHKKLGIYDQTGFDIDFNLPYLAEEPWLSASRHFDVALRLANLSGGETVLDLGAGRGWAAKHFALKGCHATAIDVVSDEQVGLGRAWALMEQAGVNFHPVIGDNENLPFFSGTFDIVFCAAVLHHTSDLPRLLKSVARVLNPGGWLIAVNEPCIGIYDDERKVLRRDASEELAFGINESRPDYLKYWFALRRAGFAEIDIAPLEAYTLSRAELNDWAAHLGGVTSMKGGLHLRRWRSRVLRLLLPPARSECEALVREALINVGGGTILVARR